MPQVTAHRVERRRGSRWSGYGALALVLVVLGSGIARASLVGGGGAHVATGGHFAAGHPTGRGFGGGRFGRMPFPHSHHGRGRFVYVYPYYPYYGYDPYDPGYPYDDAYCDPWSSYYSLQLCYGP